MNKSIYCECHEECLALCVNPKCILPAMICEGGLKNNSPCGHDHQTCKKIQWKEFEKIVNNNPWKNTPEFHSLESTIDNLFIDLISKIREEHTHFKFWLTTYGLTEQSTALITSINMSEIECINGKSISHLIQEMTQNNEKITLPVIDEKEIQRIKETIEIEFINLTEIYLKKLKDQECNGKESQIRQSNAETFSSTFNSTDKDWLKLSRPKFSTIIESPDQITSLFHKKVKEIKTLYRASENNFLAKRFHDLCDNVPNTVTLIKNEFGKIFGGFTPLKWDMHKKGFEPDTTQQSFLFSLNPEEKYRLILSQFSIANNVDCGPIFGCNDLVICDEADKNVSRTEFPICYKNEKVKRSLETSLMFSGSKIGKFLIKEWEVFAVEFEDVQNEFFIKIN